MDAFLAPLTKWLAPYFSELSLILMATLLVVYGDVINKHAKRLVSPYHFVIRTIVFVVLCAFGYGALTLYGAPFLHHVITFLPWSYQGAGYVAAFILVGVLAEQRRYI